MTTIFVARINDKGPISYDDEDFIAEENSLILIMPLQPESTNRGAPNMGAATVRRRGVFGIMVIALAVFFNIGG